MSSHSFAVGDVVTMVAALGNGGQKYRVAFIGPESIKIEPIGPKAGVVALHLPPDCLALYSPISTLIERLEGTINKTCKKL